MSGVACAAGFDDGFLGLPAPMPTPAAPTVRLDYLHFTVLFRTDRRLAAVTGVNVHGGLLIEIERKEDVWLLDPRVPAEQQAGPELYVRNDFDRGHMVRRRDPGWGSTADALAANNDTFHYTNAAPQASQLNQSPELWAGLEDYLLVHAATYEQRLSVFTGPVLAADDPAYRGVRVPLRFWKIAAWLQGDHLATAGYVLDQTEMVGPILAAEAGREGAPPPIGAFRTFQVPILDIADLAGSAMPDLIAADVLVAPPVRAEGAARAWIPLHQQSDMMLS
ncbi:endonuclease G [Nakamurella panacisegetis]|uniref:Endonuclease G n=1 Tax=Nakamurella panacisegetis TaxID=1090615 RepID=A0A1H0R9S2_9ACTN|nr:DNA/RNA non-specific endonuclease [Nakamurella panacisegetis]SDP25688.1 endonuclease G [Nakamurella panacisegetis]